MTVAPRDLAHEGKRTDPTDATVPRQLGTPVPSQSGMHPSPRRRLRPTCRSRGPRAAAADGWALRVRTTERFLALASTADEPPLCPAGGQRQGRLGQGAEAKANGRNRKGWVTAVRS